MKLLQPHVDRLRGLLSGEDSDQRARRILAQNNAQATNLLRVNPTRSSPYSILSGRKRNQVVHFHSNVALLLNYASEAQSNTTVVLDGHDRCSGHCPRLVVLVLHAHAGNGAIANGAMHSILLPD